MPREPGAMLVEVDDEVAMLEPSRPVGGRRRGPPEGGLDPRRQFGEAQWLRDVVVCPELQPADLVGFRAPRGDQDDRDPAELADPLDDLPAVEAGQRDVEDDEVGMPLVEPAQRVRPGPGDRGLIPRPTHPQLDEVREVRFVLDDEDRLSHATTSARGGFEGARDGPAGAAGRTSHGCPADHRADPRARGGRHAPRRVVAR